MRARPAIERLRAYPIGGSREGKIRLDLNESNYGCPPAVLDALRTLTPAQIGRYPEYEPLLQRMAAHYGVTPEQILLTNGADDGIRSVMQSFIDPGERLIVTDPSFSVIRLYAEGMGAAVEAVPYGDALAYPVAALAARMRTAPRLVAVVRPDSPTGSLISREALCHLLSIDREILVMLDETYHHFCGDSCLDLLADHPNLLILHSFSKAWGLAGLRLGLIFGAPTLIETLRKVVPPFSASAVAVAAAHAALGDPDFVTGVVTQVQQEKARLIRRLTALGLNVRDTATNFVLVDVGHNAPDVQRQLAARNILVKSMDHYPQLAGYLRVAIGRPEELDAFVAALRHLLATDAAGR
ncbi:MAG: aminotransferase class I/II-fold pyridoxal phosphate-dependent enzyme [Anaerolineales bacterium]|nr:aminotransferase class I/II-fold pyridoxal phosphate-dependent enzyme [Anaerolineales bacterium]MCB9126486.1 aminotransferase class I/II-fold pyridoxal phosphate-dependent enzyme [Ardenticatenales bacterium]